MSEKNLNVAGMLGGSPGFKGARSHCEYAHWVLPICQLYVSNFYCVPSYVTRSRARGFKSRHLQVVLVTYCGVWCETVVFISILKIYTKDQYIFVKIVDVKEISEVHCHQKIIFWILNIKLATSAKKSNTSTASMLR